MEFSFIIIYTFHTLSGRVEVAEYSENRDESVTVDPALRMIACSFLQFLACEVMQDCYLNEVIESNK